MNRPTVRPVPHLSFQSDQQTVLDETDALLLRRISETGSLSKAARRVGISYRNAWGRIKRMESDFGVRLIDTKVGGTAGGSARLTSQGLTLFKEFRHMRKYLFNAVDDSESAGNVSYKLSARNMIGARVTSIERGDITSMIRMATLARVTLTSIISNEAVDDLGLGAGDHVQAVVKSTEVMIAKPFFTESRRKRKHKH
ncbi:MAG TPA: TOBE domain-containing protein [Nitrososphaerales archaeon]|nr:TOBE domain-containing protein [Nitrososphaerales archaeon]